MNRSALQLKVVLFDLDGTLFDITERDAYARYQALNDLGYHVSLDDVRKRYRYGIEFVKHKSSSALLGNLV